jgi:hypothetical protein
MPQYNWDGGRELSANVGRMTHAYLDFQPGGTRDGATDSSSPSPPLVPGSHISSQQLAEEAKRLLAATLALHRREAPARAPPQGFSPARGTRIGRWPSLYVAARFYCTCKSRITIPGEESKTLSGNWEATRALVSKKKTLIRQQQATTTKAYCSLRMSLPCPVNMAKVRNHGAIIDKPSWIEVLPA